MLIQAIKLSIFFIILFKKLQCDKNHLQKKYNILELII